MKSARPRNHARHDLEQPDGAQTLVWTRRGRVRLAVLGSSVVLAAGAFAGCGAATDGSRVASANGQGSQANQPQQGQGGQGQGGQGQGGQPPQQGGQPTADQRAQFEKFRDCMKKNGFDMPDFSNGPPQGGPPGGFDPSSPKFRKAIQACQQYMPQGPPPGAGGPPGGGGPPSGSGSQGSSGSEGSGGSAAPPMGSGQSS